MFLWECGKYIQLQTPGQINWKYFITIHELRNESQLNLQASAVLKISSVEGEYYIAKISTLVEGILEQSNDLILIFRIITWFRGQVCDGEIRHLSMGNTG